MNNDKQAVTVDTPKIIAYLKYYGDDFEYNGHDQFSGGRTGGIPLVALPDALAHTSVAVARDVAEKDVEILALHRKFAAETLRADQGWARYEQANKSRMALEMERVVQAAPVAASEAIPKELRDIGELLRTQDNRITDQPMFIVQQRRRITGLDTDFCENIVWLHSEDEYSEADKEKRNSLEAEYQETGRQPAGWLRAGYSDELEFVTACFTEQGCKDYLARDGHNLNEPRIYADGSYRNAEFRTVRNWLMSLAVHAQQPAAVPAEQVQNNDGVKPAGFDVCPISGRPFWGNIDHPERGMLATYGGPFDTYSIPYLDDDDELRVERFDQDRGEWVEGGELFGWYYSEQQPEYTTPTQSPAGDLPVLPEPMKQHIDRPKGLSFVAEYYTADQMREYGRLCREAGIEEAAKTARTVLYERENAGMSEQACGAQDALIAIRALNKTGVT